MDTINCPQCGRVMWLDTRGEQAYWRCPCGGLVLERHPEHYTLITSPAADAFWAKLLRDDPRFAPPIANRRIEQP